MKRFISLFLIANFALSVSAGSEDRVLSSGVVVHIPKKRKHEEPELDIKIRARIKECVEKMEFYGGLSRMAEKYGWECQRVNFKSIKDEWLWEYNRMQAKRYENH